MNVAISIKKYVSLRDEVYPKYSIIDPSEKIWSGFVEHNVHL